MSYITNTNTNTNTHTHSAARGESDLSPLPTCPLGTVQSSGHFGSGFGPQDDAAPIPPSAPISRMAPGAYQARGPGRLP